MTDQPPDHTNDDVVVPDQPIDHGDHKPADQATNHEFATLEEAATALDITVNAVRQRLKRGTLTGVKTDNGWLVELPLTDQQPTTDRPASSRPTNQATTSTDQQPTIDLAPLVGHIASLEDQVQRLAEASTMWQIRARQAEDKLLELTAGPVAVDTQPDTSSDVPEPSLSHETGPARRLSWWRRWWES